MLCTDTFFKFPSRHIRLLPKMLLAAIFALFVQTVQAQISGTKTVCATGCDYNTISKAVADLKANGINGKTTVEIDTGQYNESISITGISGLSSTNTLTFRGMGLKPAEVRVYNNTIHIIEISNVSYVTLENIMVEQTSTSTQNYGIGMYYAKNCTIKNCYILNPVNNSNYDNTPLLTRSSTGNLIENNIIRGGYSGINEGGYNTGCSKNIYKGNIIRKFYQNGLIAYYTDQNFYTKNNIDSGMYAYGASVYSYNESNAKWLSNSLTLTNVYYGVFLYAGANNEWTNNMILGVGSASQYGVYLYPITANSSVKFYHNTIHQPGTSATCLYFYNNFNVPVDFRNNNLTHAGTGITMHHAIGGNKEVFEGNNFYSTSGTFIYYNGSAKATLAAYKTAVFATTGSGSTDQSMVVKYKSSNGLHVDQNSTMPFGRNIGVSTDFDGDIRCNWFVTSGADESNFSGNAHYTKPTSVKFTGADTVYVGNPNTFLNASTGTSPALYKWYMDGKPVSDSMHLVTAAFSSSGNKIKLVAYNCGGKDSFEKTVTVMTPASVPVADFIADVTQVEQNSIVKFTDVSANYPSGWQWQISPEHIFIDGVKTETYTVIYGSLTQQNPQVKFLLPGKYKVCLKATNIKGSSSEECKTEYIEVIAAENMSSNATLTASRGFIYDNGGPNSNYSGSYNSRNKLLIDACADSVFLVFTKFDLQCGADFINVYEGKDNTGTNLYSKCAKAQTHIGTGYSGGPSSTYCAFGSTPGCYPAKTDTLKAKGTMFIEMGIYSYTPMPGFEAYYWTTPNKEKAPVAKFTVPDSICINGSLSFSNTTSGTNVKYYWDLDGDMSVFESTVKNPDRFYYLDGPVTVTLIAENCGGRDTFSKTIYVFVPARPKADFSADNTNPTTTDVVFFSPELKECADIYKWRFTALSGTGKATYINGTKNTSAHPQVTFTDTGCYSATLYVANAAGEDSITKSCYVYVKAPYCIPAVNALTADIGISKVSLKNISNSTSQSVNAYSNYLAQLQHSAILEEGVNYTLTVERNTNKNKATRSVWIDWNLDGDFNDTLELVAQEINSTNLSWSTNIKMPAIAQYGATIMRIGIDVGLQQAKPCGTNQTGEFEDYRLYLRAYTTKPVISLHGVDTVVLQRGYPYTDTTVTATSLRFGDISGSIVRTMPLAGFNAIEGVHVIKYDVTDSAGNKAQTAIRTIIVVADTTAPEVIVDGADTILHQVFVPFYQPAILRAYDVADSTNLNIIINDNVNNTVLGMYTVFYSVSDRSNNTTEVTRFIKVVDTILPILTLFGTDTVLHQAGKTYSDLGVMIKDNYFSEAELRNNLEIQSNVNVDIIGNYSVNYILTDPYTGKKIKITRVVLVRDTEKPSLKLIGDEEHILDVLTTYNDPGIQMSDNFDNKLTYKAGGSFYTAFPNGRATTLGNYEITYTVTDASGNTSTISRKIKVLDREAPKVILKGEPTISVCRWSIYTDAGADVSDNYNDSTELKIEQDGNFLKDGTGWDGIYSLRYKATDKSGNIGYSAYRYIYVQNPYESPCSTNVGLGKTEDISQNIKVYPNPNQGKFNVEIKLPLNEQVRISVSNVLGQELAVISNGQLNANTFTVDISNQKAGVYMLTIFTSKQTITKPILITK